MTVSRVLSNLPSDLANNLGKILSVDYAGNMVWADNTASSNTIYIQTVNDLQNTNITSINTYAGSAYGLANAVSTVNSTQNTNITNVNTLAQSAYNAANTAGANTVYQSGVDTTQNTNITNVNTLASAAYGLANAVSTVNSTQNTNITNVNTLAQSAYDSSNTKFSTSGGNISGPVTISSNLTVTGNLIVSGNVTSVNANNLNIQDNMIYLNRDGYNANPDLGIAGAYNDGTYRHAGFFRDASDGYWKVFDQYLPEPDSSIYIDTSNTSFRIADFQANNVTFGKISTSSSVLVSNLNADLLDGQSGSYYAVATEQSGINATQNTNITNVNTYASSAYGLANAVSTVNSTQNTNITNVNTLASAAYAQANTDYTTISTTAGNYGGTTAIPVITVAANGRISSVANTSITAGATITDDTTSNATRYVMLGTATSGSYITANTSSSKLSFNPSTGTLSSTVLSSTVATGTSPLSISSTTLVTNLNADYLDGQHGSYYAVATEQSGINATQNTNITNVNTYAGAAYGLANAVSTVNSTQNTNITNVNTLASAAYAQANTVTNYLPLSGGTLTGRVIQSSSGFGVATITDITTRTNSGFYQTSNATTALGWPQTTSSWYHLLTSTHSNDANYYSMQFAADFYNSGSLYYRSTNGSGTTAWNKVWHEGNDGAGSGLDADLLDGQSGTYYTNASNLASGTVPTARLATGTANSTTYLRGDQTWATISAGGATGGGSDQVFYENANTVTSNYTISTGKNAGSFGPVTINNGVTITVPNGSVWTIV